MCSVAAIFLLLGCGGGGGSTTLSTNTEDDTNTTTPPPSKTTSIQGIAQLGIVKQANVEIFKVTDYINARFEKLYTETTSDGDMNSAGRFNTHSAELEDDRFYVYQVSGGIDIDTNDDGVEDEVQVSNKGVFRALVKGSWLKEMTDDTFRVTAVSEYLYQKCYNEIAYTEFDRGVGIQYWADWESQKILETDLNGDGIINPQDILVFNPINDRESLSQLVNDKYTLMVDDIHNQNDSYAVNLRNVYSTISPLQKVDYLNSMPESYATKISPDDQTLYKVGDDYFSIIDVTDPKAIRYIGVVADDGARDLAISHNGNTAYTVSYRGLSVIDISNASDPQVITTYPIDLAGEIVISDNDQTLYIDDDRYGLKIFDVSDRTTPQLISSYAFDEPANNARVTSLALSSDNRVLYVTNTTKGLKALDVSDPANPNEIAGIAMTYPEKVVLSPDDSVAYVSDGTTGIKAVDVSDLNQMTMLSMFADGPDEYARSITISEDGEKLFVAGTGTRVRAYDIKNPARPVLLDDDTYMEDLSPTPIHITASHDGTMLYLSNGISSHMSIYFLGMHDEAIQ